jgi:hypothetical protein
MMMIRRKCELKNTTQVSQETSTKGGVELEREKKRERT